MVSTQYPLKLWPSSATFSTHGARQSFSLSTTWNEATVRAQIGIDRALSHTKKGGCEMHHIILHHIIFIPTPRYILFRQKIKKNTENRSQKNTKKAHPTDTLGGAGSPHASHLVLLCAFTHVHFGQIQVSPLLADALVCLTSASVLPMLCLCHNPCSTTEPLVGQYREANALMCRSVSL